MVVILAIMTLFLPSVFLLNLRTNYEIRKFESVNSYLEQLLYSFRRKPKILTALQDTVLYSKKKRTQNLEKQSRKRLHVFKIRVAMVMYMKKPFRL